MKALRPIDIRRSGAVRRPRVFRLVTGLAPVGLLSTALFCAMALGQKPPAATPATKETRSDAGGAGRPWKITFEELTHSDATGEGDARTVVATSDEGMVLKADIFRWNDKRKTAHATGNLHIADDQVEGAADTADIEYVRDKRLIVLKGQITFTIKPRKPAATGTGDAAAATQPPNESAASPGPTTGADGKRKSDDEEAGLRDYPITVTCDQINYEYARDKRHAVITGNFKAVQKLNDSTRTLTAQSAEWFGPDEKLVLKPPVHMEDTRGRQGDTDEEVVIMTRSGSESLKLRKGVYSMPAESDDQPTRPGTDAKGSPTQREGPPPSPARARP